MCFSSFSTEICCLLTHWEWWDWTQTVKLWVRQINNEVKLNIKLCKAESCFFLGWSVQAAPFFFYIVIIILKSSQSTQSDPFLCIYLFQFFICWNMLFTMSEIFKLRLHVFFFYSCTLSSHENIDVKRIILYTFTQNSAWNTSILYLC